MQHSVPRRAFPALLLLTVLTAAGCNREGVPPDESASAPGPAPTTPAAAQDGTVLATVNGRSITRPEFDHFLRQKQQSGAQDIDALGILNEMINIDLLTEVAIVAGYDQREDVSLELERQRRNLLAGMVLRERLANQEVSEREIQAEYERRYANADRQQYRARHILVRSEDEAKSIIEQLDAGADFAALAQESSVGPSGANGGDLGWFSTADMVPEFAAAVKALKKDDYTNVPVMTQFGWHVILAEDSREVEPPALEDVRGQLTSAVAAGRLASYLQELRGRAEIEVKIQ